MAYRVSVRDLRHMKETYLQRGLIPLPVEAEHNSFLLREVLGEAWRILPSCTRLDSNELKCLAEGVAYLLRPDLIKQGLSMRPLLLPRERDTTPKRSWGKFLHDPAEITLKLKIPETCRDRAAEFFRCYTGTLDCMSLITQKLSSRGSPHDIMSPSFALADITAYLIDPENITDYTYTPEEVEAYEMGLAADLASE